MSINGAIVSILYVQLNCILHVSNEDIDCVIVLTINEAVSDLHLMPDMDCLLSITNLNTCFTDRSA